MFFVAILVFIDQITKYFAVCSLKEDGPFVILKDVFELRYLENTGAAFGIMQGGEGIIFNDRDCYDGIHLVGGFQPAGRKKISCASCHLSGDRSRRNRKYDRSAPSGFCH